MSRVGVIYPKDRMTLREVGLRDGLQLVDQFPSTQEKIAWIDAEYAAGVRHFELGSFLPADRFPQFAGLPALLDAAMSMAETHKIVLALNERGIDDAVSSHADEITCVVSATEEHSLANSRRTRQQAIALVKKAAGAARLREHRPITNAGIAMAFGCSIAGEVDQSDVLRLAETCLAAGADMVSIADTVGYAGPRQVASLCDKMVKLCDDRPFCVHLHDTRGTGIANAAAALDHGARILDGALGGLGGCPFAPGATGNVVFEDLVYLCERMGFATGIDLHRLAEARAVAESAMPDEPFYGALARSGPPANLDWRAGRQARAA